MSGQWGPKVRPLRPHGKPLWWAKCQTTVRADPLNNLFNCVLALREDPNWLDQLRFDEMLRAPILHGASAAITDADCYCVHLWMQEQGLEKMPLEVVREGVEIVAREHPFHPLRDRLEALVWDGVNRASDWTHTYLGSPDDSYHASIGYWFLVGMVARVMRPGCKMDYMLVLEGPQGKRKSQAAAILAGEQYFSDALPDLAGDPVRLSTHLRGKWIIEVPELSAFSSTKLEAAKLKAFLTRPIEQYTPKFGRADVVEPRQCVFIGTTNKSAYLRDETGGRRFWPVKCGVIDLDALRRDRDQLLAEAVDAYQQGKQWWPPDDFEEKVIKPEQNDRYDEDAWEEAVLAYLGGKWQVTLLDVAQNALDFNSKSKLSRADQNRIANALQQAGWTQGKRTGSARYWVKP